MQTRELRINKRIQKLVASSTLAITARAKELQSQGADVVNFAGGEPDFDTPQEIKDAAVKAINDGFTKYTPSTGILELRKAISAKFKKDNQLNYTPEQIAVSCGAKHSLYCAIQVLVDEGDEVLIPAPYWVSYPEQVKLAGGTPKFIETSADTDFKLTAEQLQDHITPNTRMLILNSPSNPTGSVYHRAELEAIAKVCVQHQIFVISDEIYEKLLYDLDEYTSIAALGKDIYDLTITVNGVSKAYSMTGWRIGYAAGPKEVMDHIKNFQDHSTSNPTSISQKAALQALLGDEKIVRGMCQQFKERRDLMMKLVDEIPRFSYVRPQGAFYLFCDVGTLGNSMELAKRILDEAKVAIIPGDGFGAPGFVRLSFSTSSERIKEGIKRIADWINK